MAAQNTTIPLPADVWTLVTTNNVSRITFRNDGVSDIRVIVLTSTALPAVGNINGSIVYKPGEGELYVALVELALGLTTPVRIAALSQGTLGRLFVSHAAS